MSYDALAPFYATLERLTFGAALQRARGAPLCLDVAPSRVLVLGDGDGRFLERALVTWPSAQFVVVDQSATMLAMAKKRAGEKRVRFYRADIRDGLSMLDEGRFDMVVSHFFLDCFTEQSLEKLLPELVARLVPEGVWCVSEFAKDRWWQRTLIWLMYRFFHGLTETEAQAMPDYGLLMAAAGMMRRRLGAWRGGFVVSEVWECPER